jgi:hypothetical protein
MKGFHVKGNVRLKTEFLPDPASIRKAIHGLASDSKRLDLAVAFIGPEWERLLGNYLGPIRAICWLSHPATDPDAVKLLMKRKDSFVMQRTGLHTKVYLAPGVGAIVGSANLSHPALAERVGLPQCEAAIRVTDQTLIKEVGNWFNLLWNDLPRTKAISEADLERAKKERKKWPIQVVNTTNPIPPLPKKLPLLVMKLAKQVQGIDLTKEFRKKHDELSAAIAKPKLHRADISKLADLLASWTGHRAIYKRFETQPAASVLRGLCTLLDEGKDVRDRLQEIEEKGLLKGLQIPAMSLLLYWYRPDAYPPFNVKTQHFLKYLKMESHGMSASSPACYSTWLECAEVLRTRLQLPSVGHVDRVVTRYYDRLSDKAKVKR